MGNTTADPMTGHRVRRDRGFTLIELLVVVIILGVLSSIAVPVYLSQRDKAAKRVTEANMRNLMADVQTARDNKQAVLWTITSPCSNCPCRDLATPRKVNDPAFVGACRDSFDRFVNNLALAAGTTPESVRAMATDGWGYPILPDENEGEPPSAWNACGNSVDTFFSGGKDHVIMGSANGTGADDVKFTAPASGYC